jgi:hypothetical protein
VFGKFVMQGLKAQPNVAKNLQAHIAVRHAAFDVQ